MIRKLFIIIFLSFLSFSPVNAKSSDQQAQALINAVKAGEDITSFSLPDVTRSELEWLSSLRSCAVKLSPLSTKSQIIILWRCDEKAQKGMTIAASEVATSMFFTDNEMKEFWIDLSYSAFKKLTSSANTDGLMRPKDTAKNFYNAVVDGLDPSLGGLVPLHEGQLRRLKQYKGCKAKRMSGSTNTRQHYLWNCRNRNISSDLITIGFDLEKRPLGIEFGFVTRRPLK